MPVAFFLWPSLGIRAGLCGSLEGSAFFGHASPSGLCFDSCSVVSSATSVVTGGLTTTGSAILLSTTSGMDGGGSAALHLIVLAADGAALLRSGSIEIKADFTFVRWSG